MPFEIVRNDITKMRVDAVVCNGNTRLVRSGGVCGAIFDAAGPRLMIHCAMLPGCDTGAAVVTPGYDLPAKYVIHTVGPHWNGGQSGEEEILRTCYKNVLNAAAIRECRTVAVPMIATGRYRFPKDLAMRIAKEEIERFLESHEEMTVYLVVYGPRSTTLARELQEDLREFVTNEDYRAHLEARRRRPRRREPAEPEPDTLEDAVQATDPGFSDLLMHYVEKSGEEWLTIYRRAGVAKSVASKIKTNPDYKPSKQTALAFAISLRLPLHRTEKLLRSFGASLSPASRADNIVKYFILKEVYDIDTINEALYDYGEPTFPINFL